ncbi:uncharacterized protein LOC127806498 [Diospyros lotus]|uniref:uncharacterized protein LOC127806498 n=1 Tax=Diospyros lotus TaxID=55363 RepID=UPI0022559A6F|nr:uncharacterized protein LOC127806498 [Diospyros lotus]
MENGAAVLEEKEAAAAAASSYRYWVREKGEDAAPLPVPKKLASHDLDNSTTTHLGSVWNRAGTWEEKNLNKWASERIKELITSVGSLEFSGGRAEITEVSKCVGDAFLVIVRNKKRVGYTYELSLSVKGEWLIGEEKKKVKGYLDIPEFSVGELNDLQFEVRLKEEKDLPRQDKLKVSQDLKLFLHPVREKLLQFEQELKDR